eukprot:GHVP01048326.1.p1 GENE.GHVP01048326.1~~GHVP01048326.1.p1  ORF type:complete len:351 (-),score=71.57 GHVP01048326.1:953-2005(-)
MGIKGLRKIIADKAPAAMKEIKLGSLHGREIAIDVSMCLYQYLVSVRSNGFSLTTETGDTTSHIVGLFYRSIRLLEEGVKPVFVFDGKAPEMKAGELAKRKSTKQDALTKQDQAKEEGDMDEMIKQAKRSVRVTQKHADDIKKLFGLMGIPFIQAPGEAEAQCTEMCKMGLVYGVASEDMDTLSFGSPILIKYLTLSEARKIPITEIRLSSVLKGLEMTEDEFIDFCILLGCDYCTGLKGIGPTKAFQLIKKYNSIEKIIENIDERHKPDEDWPYKEARHIIKNPDVIKDIEELKSHLIWKQCNKVELEKYLVKECGFGQERFDSGMNRIDKAVKKGKQVRLDKFFKKRV